VLERLAASGVQPDQLPADVLARLAAARNQSDQLPDETRERPAANQRLSPEARDKLAGAGEQPAEATEKPATADNQFDQPDQLPPEVRERLAASGLQPDQLPPGARERLAAAGVRPDQLPAEARERLAAAGMRPDQLPAEVRERLAAAGMKGDQLPPGVKERLAAAGIRPDQLPGRPGAGPGGPARMGGMGGGRPAAMMGGGAVVGEKASDLRGSARRLLGMMRSERMLVVVTLLLGVASVALLILGPKLLGHATDLIFTGVVSGQMSPDTTKEQVIAGLRAQGNDTVADMFQAMPIVPGQGIDFDQLGMILLTVLGLYLVASVLGVVQGRLGAAIVQRLMYRLREQAQAKLAHLPPSYFDSQSRGELLSRVTNDIDNLSQTLQQALSQVITSVLTVIGVLVMMLVISPLLALIALVTVPLSMYTATRIAKRARPNFIAQWATTGRLTGHIEEMYSGHALVRSFGRQEQARQSFREQNTSLYESSAKAQFASGTIQPTMAFINNLNYVLIAVVGALRVASGAISLGDVQAFIQYSRQFNQPITQLASMANLLQSGIASAERVFALLDAEEQSPDPEHPVTLENVVGNVTFHDISFRYKQDTPLIENLSLTVDPGQTVAIVGPTGAGKTTLVNLLMRFYEVSSGRITIDGVDIAAMRREDVRSQIGMVLQDAWLFGGTIAENIAYGRPGATHDEIVEAARATHVDHFARTLPDGYDTVIDNEGGSLSAGEKQLITIARAFLAERPILILDEATSSVDTRTEVLIQRAMSSLRHGRTSFVIAHRLSTIRDADTILMMENGQIVEQGTHEELIQARGAYAQLYAAQFEQAMADVD
jgi:ATP-binding cassette subfamily B protein